MPYNISRRRIIVSLCFAVWIGAAGLICRTFVARPIEGEQTELKLTSPAEVVQTESNVTPTRMALAEK
ncbi:MAG TPA: hypothetical protein VHX86_14940 [Tepidisphaeraceae bacterium]|jgi:hypothetical protein|nr:hypothetical protein [Tepidisphaeraceae bacterium]